MRPILCVWHVASWSSGSCQQDTREGEVSYKPGSKVSMLSLDKSLHWSQAQGLVGEAIKVTLHDCLACSGCVTSAETVLLESQSGSEVMSKLRQASNPDADGGCSSPVVVVSLSPQSIAALAGKHNMLSLTFCQCCPWNDQAIFFLNVFAGAVFYDMGFQETFSCLSRWFRWQGAAAVLDVRDGRDLALLETAAEFIERYRTGL